MLTVPPKKKYAGNRLVVSQALLALCIGEYSEFILGCVTGRIGSRVGMIPSRPHHISLRKAFHLQVPQFKIPHELMRNLKLAVAWSHLQMKFFVSLRMEYFGSFVHWADSRWPPVNALLNKTGVHPSKQAHREPSFSPSASYPMASRTAVRCERGGPLRCPGGDRVTSRLAQGYYVVALQLA